MTMNHTTNGGQALQDRTAFSVGKILVPAFLIIALFLFGAPVWAEEADTSNSEPCVDQSIDDALNNASKKDYVARATAINDSFDQSWQQENKSPITNTHGDLMKTKCFKLVLSDYFDKIRKFLSGDWIEALLTQLIESILNQACQFIASAINSLLNSICLPIPTSFSLSWSLPTLSMSSCSGMSLGSLISAQYVPVQMSWPKTNSLSNQYGSLASGVSVGTTGLSVSF